MNEYDKNFQIFQALGNVLLKHGIDGPQLLEHLMFSDDFTDDLLNGDFSEDEMLSLQDDLTALNFYFKTVEVSE